MGKKHFLHNCISRFVTILLFLFVFTSCQTFIESQKYNYGAPPQIATVELDDLSKYQITYQPVQDYNISRKEIVDGHKNVWRYYTRIGTDCGEMGTEKRHIEDLVEAESPGLSSLDTHAISLHLYHDQWVGIWHTLQGLAEQKKPGIKFTSPYSNLIEEEYQPKVVGAYVRVKGKGNLKLELNTIDEKGRNYVNPILATHINLEHIGQYHNLVWIWKYEVDKEHPWNNVLLRVDNITDISNNEQIRQTINNRVIKDPRITLINWVAEKRGTDLVVDEIGLIMLFPKLPAARRYFLKSLAKLTMCYDSSDYARQYILKDRANFPPGHMDNVATSGLFCLALAAAQSEKIVSRDDAINVLHRIHKIISHESFPRDSTGLLPHFVTFDEGAERYILARSTENRPSEFSTIDTSLYFHSMLLASNILGQEAVSNELISQIKAIQFDRLILQEDDKGGYVSMGVVDGKLLEAPWDAWGGETALVLCLKKMANGKGPYKMKCPNMSYNGTQIGVYEGRGFIAELPSLFYPDFANDIEDAFKYEGVNHGVNWLQIRRNLLASQIRCTLDNFTKSKAAKAPILYGYSSGEDIYEEDFYLENGLWRTVGGRRVPPKPLIFPHYILMSACIVQDISQPIKAINKLEDYALFTPWGMVENFDVNLGRSLALISSLNASFEALSAYHLLCRCESRTDEDVIYNASASSSIFRNAVRLFYPEGYVSLNP